LVSQTSTLTVRRSAEQNTNRLPSVASLSIQPITRAASDTAPLWQSVKC